MSIAALARRVGLSPTAVTQRLARLRDIGVIFGFSALLDPRAFGLPLTAYVRLRPFQGSSKAFRRAVTQIQEVVECHHTTGDDCYLIKVVARDMPHLEEVTERIAGHGETTTSLVYSSVVQRRAFTSM